MNARKFVNIKDDRELQALSEYIITFLKRYFYSDEKFKKLVEEIKPSLWESGYEGAFIVFNLFW